MNNSSWGEHAPDDAAASAATKTNPADNDFDRRCIQCIDRYAEPLTLFRDNDPVRCCAFCSIDCAEMFAFEMANNQSSHARFSTACCVHLVPDGEYCSKCREEYLAAAQARIEGGA